MSDQNFTPTTIPENSLYTFDDNNDRVLDNQNGKLFRYTEWDRNVYDERTFEPTQDLPLQAKTTTPTTEEQTITSDTGYMGLSRVVVQSIPNTYADVSNVTATASDVALGKVFVNSQRETVVGIISTQPSADITLTTVNPSHTYQPGYYNNEQTVSIQLEQKTSTPQTVSQTITPTTGKVLSAVVVNSIPVTRVLNAAGGYTVTIAGV